jgi:hypothetical protein
MIRAYYYLFYKLYKFGEWSPSTFPSDWTSTLAILALEIGFLISLKVYYFDFFDRNDDWNPLALQTIIPFGAILLLNCFAFLINDKWKVYVNEFDQWPKSKNLIGTWVVVGIFAFVIANIVISFHIMGQITGVH